MISGIVGKSTSREYRQKIKEDELDIRAAMKVSDVRTKLIEEIERTELREKQLTEALSFE